MSNTVCELLDSSVADSKESLRSSLLGLLINQIPHSVSQGKLFVDGSDLGQYSDFELAHGVEKVGVILRVDRDEGVLVPFDGRERSWDPILDVPEHSPA